MFERYTEKSRRAIFFARYEASQFGSPYIETEHLLLGLVREDKGLTNRYIRSHAAVESIRKQIDEHTTIREKVSTSIDLPLSNESKRVLAYAAEEAERFSHKHIGTEHLLLGMLREEKCFAAEVLTGRGVRLEQVREEVARTPSSASPQHEGSSIQKENILTQFGRNLTQEALDNPLEPAVGREKEIEEIIEVLCSRIGRNPMLIQEKSMESAATVELLAQLIANGTAPEFLANKQLWALDLEQIVGGTTNRLVTVVNALAKNPDRVLFIDEIQEFTQLDATGAFRRAIADGEIQCIGAMTTANYERAVKDSPWLLRYFRKVKVLPMSEPEITRSLLERKATLEKFHAVSYPGETIESAVRLTSIYFPGEAVSERAMQLLDVAGARVKLRVTLPEEVAEAQKRIKLVIYRMENSIANHEFEKARFYSDEERKERENLRALREKYHLNDTSAGTVTVEDIESVVSSLTGISVASIKKGLTS
jgi:ATP-dependent Clp protease ATP-binding subunit ClpC